jgi:hypothetical protein
MARTAEAVPLTLSYSGLGNLSGNTATTVDGAGATFSGLSVDTAGSGTLSHDDIYVRGHEAAQRLD